MTFGQSPACACGAPRPSPSFCLSPKLPVAAGELFDSIRRGGIRPVPLAIGEASGMANLSLGRVVAVSQGRFGGGDGGGVAVLEQAAETSSIALSAIAIKNSAAD